MADLFISKKKITLSALTINIYQFLKPKKHYEKVNCDCFYCCVYDSM